MKVLFGITAVAAAACLSFVAPAQAVTNFTLNDIEGEYLQINVQLESVTQNVLGTLFDGVKVSLNVVPGGNYADMRSVYFHLADPSLLSGTFATGDSILTFPGAPLDFGGQIDEDDVTNLGLGNNITGLVADTYGGFDVGLNIGNPLDFNDYASGTFFVGSTNGPITEEMFQTFAFAVHAEHVGSNSTWLYRWGTSDLAGIVPGNGVQNQNQGGPNNNVQAIAATPEPATAALGLLSLAGLAAASRRRRNK